MSVNHTMRALYIAHECLESLTDQLEKDGCKMAAAELRREVSGLGCQLTQIDGVLDDYQVDIGAVQLCIPIQTDVPDQAPVFIGVDMGKADIERFKQEGSGRVLRLEK